MSATLKRCAGCKRELPRAEFHRNATKPDGLQSVCRTCAKDWRARNPGYAARQQAERRARARGRSPEGAQTTCVTLEERAASLPDGLAVCRVREAHGRVYFLLK
jgi:hypothetical protein